MSADDDLDALLDLMERRARLLSESGGHARAHVNATNAKDRLRYGDTVATDYYFERILFEEDGRLVLLVRHRNSDVRFAMKVLPRELSNDSAEVAAFRDEAGAVSSLGHENIVFVTEFGHADEIGHYYMMEYLNGETLARRLMRRVRRPLWLALDVAACAGGALAVVHDLGFVHRNVYPGNLMSHRDGETETWKLLGFGRASTGDDALEVHALRDRRLYIAPEVVAGAPASPAADQFALAATLFHCVFGTPPWPDRTWESARPENWTLPAAPFGHQLGAAAAGLYEALATSLAAAPSDRFDSVDDLLTAFQEASGESRRASVSPADALASNRLADDDPPTGEMLVDMSFDSLGVEVGADISGSVEVELSDILGGMEVRLSFRSARRLRREWRRNIIGGGVFVPTRRLLDVGSPVYVVIDFVPAQASRRIPGVVIGREVTPAPGIAVELDPARRAELHQFISGLNLGAFEPKAIVQQRSPQPDHNDLTSDERFVLSKLLQPLSVGALRRLFTNLPVPIDDVIARLEEKGWVEVGDEKRTRTISRPGYDSGEEPEVSIKSVFQRANYLRDQGNFAAEIETLQLAAERYADPELLHRLAFARLRFHGDVPGATRDIERAIKLDPQNPKYQAVRDSLVWFVRRAVQS